MSFPKRLHGGVRIMNRPSPINVRRLDQNAMPMFLDMQRRGMLLDIPAADDLAVRLVKDMNELRERIADESGTGLDCGSPDQVAIMLFDRLKLPKTGIKQTKSGKRLTVDDDALKALTVYHPIPKLIQDFREMDKIRGTYAEPLSKLAKESPDGRVRTTWKLTRVVSGRASSADPNLMNIPVRSELGREVRRLFRPRKRRVYVSVDESQIEMRIAAHEACEWVMIELFKRGRDLHTMTASLMFGVPYEKVTKEQRGNAKTAGFGVLYGITAMGLLTQFIAAGAVGWTEAKCQELIDGWFKAYANIKRWLRLQHMRAQQYGAVWCMWGRTRWIPEAISAHDQIVSAGQRNAGNTPVQAGAQGTMKLSMAYIWDVVLPKWWARGYDPWPLIQVHDELIFEVEEEIAEEFGKDVQEAIENCCELRVPIKCGLALSAVSWGDLEK